VKELTEEPKARFLDVFSGIPGEMFGVAASGFNPNGIGSFSPRVARLALPWVNAEKNHNPARVESVS
jgi:hypothetical protein